MKKILLILWALMLPLFAVADRVTIDGIYYELNNYPYIAVVTSGSYTGSVVIPSTVNYRGTNYSVTSIGSEAFMTCTTLTSISIPNSVTSIGRGVFRNCSALSSITVEAGNPIYDSRNNCNAIIETGTNALLEGCKNTIIPNNVTSIGDWAFGGRTGLVSITIPNSVTSIRWNAFSGCSALTTIKISNSVNSIDLYAFSGCSALTSITIPNSVTRIDESAFEGCSALTSISVEAGNPTYDSRNNCNAIIVTEKNTLLLGCKNTVIPNSVTSIAGSAFSGCSALTSITIPNSVTSIGWNAFSGCSALTSITIPNSVTSIGWNAFSGCSALTSITIPNSVTSIGGSAFSGCTGLTSITIPNSVTTIGESAFSGCSALTLVVINSNEIVSKSYSENNGFALIFGNQVQEYILGNGITSIGGYAFYGCSALTSITIPNSVTSIGGSAFSGCSALISIKIPNSVTRIGWNAFYGCSALTSITIPNSVTSIGGNAFSGCSSLTSITIPNSVTRIESSAFSGCAGLTSIIIPISVTEIDESAFEGCSALTSIKVETGNPTYDSRNNCNAIIVTGTNTLLAGCKNTVIPNSVASIGEGAFSGCSALTSITIPNSVTSIGSKAFSGCSALTSITIPNSVTNFKSNAFRDCSALAIVIINSNEIVSDSYSENKGFALIFGNQVQEYILGKDITSIGNNAFSGCSGMTSINIPYSVTNIGDGAFKNCKIRTLLAKGIKPPSVKTSAFSDMMCHHTILYVPAGSWDAYAFDSNWYVFNNIREVAIKEEQVSERQTYMLMNTVNFSYSVYDPVNDGVGVIKSFNGVNEDNPNHCWQLLKAAGKHYMYNVGARKFLVKANNEIGMALSERPETINFQDGADGIILGGDTSKNWAMVRNESTFANQQIITGIDLVSNSTPMDNDLVYNLNGQRIVKPQKGINIIRMNDGTNRKVLVK